MAISQMNSDSLLIIYGSQTGQSESIAKQLYERLDNQTPLNSRIFCMDESEKQFWLEREALVVIVCSSTGDGDPPDNASKFVRRLCRKDRPADILSHLTFALLGLGDSNYSTFLGVPKKVESHLKIQGAKELIPAGFADDQVGLEIVVDSWIEKLISTLHEYFCKIYEPGNTIFTVNMLKSDNNNIDKVQNLIENVAKMSIETKRPFAKMLKLSPIQYSENEPCLIHGSTKLSQDQELRVPVVTIPFLDVTIEDEKMDTSNIPWQNNCKLTGTVGGIRTVPVIGTILLSGPDAKKEKREIQIDIRRTDVNYWPGDAFYFVCPNPMEEVNFILNRLDLLSTAENRLVISVQSETSKKNAIIPHFVPPSCSARYLLTHCLDIRRAPGRPLLRVFAEYTSDSTERRRLLELCSSQGVQEFTQFVRQAGLSLVDILHAFPSCLPPIQRLIGRKMKLAQRFFNTDELNQKNCAKVERWLFFGCQNFDQDLIYREELESLLRANILTKLVICESRPTNENNEQRPRFVQDALLAHGTEVAQFLESDKNEYGRQSLVYLCGDAEGMSNDVWKTFISIVATHLDKSESEAKMFLMNLKSENRYIEDVWS